MGQAIGQVLGLAVGVAISPVPVIALILMLFSRRATTNSVAFLGGWLIGLVVVSIIVLSIGIQASGENADSGGWIKLVIGVLFLALAIGEPSTASGRTCGSGREWGRRRPSPARLQRVIT